MSEPEKKPGRRDFLKRSVLGLMAGATAATTMGAGSPHPEPRSSSASSTLTSSSLSTSTVTPPPDIVRGNKDYTVKEWLNPDGWTKTVQYEMHIGGRKGGAHAGAGS